MEKKEIKNIFAQKQEHIVSEYDKYFSNRLFSRYIPGIIVESLYVIALMIFAFFLGWLLLRWF
ncbi:MAG: hypothetical protein HY776_03615 [Actinobacteria bacterium]|nr:hypothetical protein [Actinomycetota bacterium]